MSGKPVEEAFADNLRWVQGNTEFDSQAKIGRVADVHQKTVGRWMAKDHPPTIGNLVALAAKLRIEVWQLLAPGFGKGLYYIDEDRQIVPVLLPTATKRASRAA